MEKMLKFLQNLFAKEISREEEQEVVRKIYEKIRESK